MPGKQVLTRIAAANQDRRVTLEGEPERRDGISSKNWKWLRAGQTETGWGSYRSNKSQTWFLKDGFKKLNMIHFID